jgi:hypothetical protein
VGLVEGRSRGGRSSVALWSVPHADPNLPYSSRDVARLAVEADVCVDVMLATLRGEPLKSRARQRAYRTIAAAGLLAWIARPGAV